MDGFLGHCYFIPFYPIVFLAKLRFLSQHQQYSWLNSDSPRRFVSTGWVIITYTVIYHLQCDGILL